MTDAAPARTGPRQAWTIGGILLLVCAGLSVVEPALMFTALFTPVSWARTLAFSAALVVFAVGSQLIADIVYSFLNPRIRYA